MYAVYHGPEGLKAIASRIHKMATALRAAVKRAGFDVGEDPIFDTVLIKGSETKIAEVLSAARSKRMNFRVLDKKSLTVSLDETVTDADLKDMLSVFGAGDGQFPAEDGIPASLRRSSPFLTHKVFHEHRSESEMLRYLRKLESRDLSLVHSMIPLGSCTMKLNAAAEMLPVTWPEFGRLHPCAPAR
jgi:glycine dehydrogenase